MAVKGVFASDQHIQGARKGDFASSLLQIWPNGTAPLLALSSGMQSTPAQDTVVTWFEENHLTGRAKVTAGGGINSSATSLATTDASFVVAGSIFLVEATGEFIFVTGVSSNTLTIERGFAGTTAASIANDAFLQKIGTAQEEGSSKPVAVANLGYPRFNYTQIFRNTWSVTGSTRAVEYYTGSQVAKNKSDCAQIHAEDIERSMWFSRRSISVRNSKPFRTMDGILVQITSNVVTEAGNTTWDEIDGFLETVFRRNVKGQPNERIAFCGNGVITVINKLARISSTTFIEPGTTEFGMNVRRWQSPFGTIMLMTHPLFVESPLWTKDLYVLHPAAIRTRWLRRTSQDDYDANGTRAGVDADEGVITSELCVEYRAEVTGGKFTNITTAA